MPAIEEDDMDETISLSRRAFDRLPVDLLVVPIAADRGSKSPFATLDRRAGGRLRRDATRLGFTGAIGQELWLHPSQPGTAHTVLLLGAGPAPRLSFWYELADALVRHAGRLRAARAAIALGAFATPEVVGAVAEGIALARYTFTRYRSRPPREAALAVTLQVDAVSAAQRRSLAEATVYA
ncbi:MAG: M17 family peptidase N-terminal domain-containing protein, partial [Candidatus Binatia bacterium]